MCIRDRLGCDTQRIVGRSTRNQQSSVRQKQHSWFINPVPDYISPWSTIHEGVRNLGSTAENPKGKDCGKGILNQVVTGPTENRGALTCKERERERDRVIARTAGKSGTWKSRNECIVARSTELLAAIFEYIICLLYTSPSPRDRQKSRMPSSA